MKGIFRSAALLAVCFICLLLAGCKEEQRQAESKRKSEIAFSACVKNGGVPIQAWFNAAILGDCKYPPVSK